MATIYRVIVEQKNSGGGTGRNTNGAIKKATAKQGKWVSALNSEKGGVEHNRKLRAINPVLNKATNGYWEKGTRLGRAGLGLIQTNTETGAMRLSPTAIAIIISFALITVMKIINQERLKAQKLNAQNYKMLENGVGAIHSAYSVSVNGITGRQTYNQNK